MGVCAGSLRLRYRVRAVPAMTWTDSAVVGAGLWTLGAIRGYKLLQLLLIDGILSLSDGIKDLKQYKGV